MEWRVGGDDYEWQRGCHAASFSGIQGGYGHDQWRESHGHFKNQVGELRLGRSINSIGRSGERKEEKEYVSKIWNAGVVTNVTKPTLTIFKPAPEERNGTAIVVCPGGGFMALSITSEGSIVAKYLAAKGVTAFVLKYRLVHTGEDATQEFSTLIADRQKFGEIIGKVIPQSNADGLAAVTYVRQHASEWGISPDRVGIIGFSAGGEVAAGAGFQYTPEGRPAFVAPIYPAGTTFKDTEIGRAHV